MDGLVFLMVATYLAANVDLPEGECREIASEVVTQYEGVASDSAYAAEILLVLAMDVAKEHVLKRREEGISE